MKKFNTSYSGLLPIHLNDIRFMQEAYDEQIEALIKPYLPFTDYDSFILSGCEFVANTYAAGWVVIQGKIYRVPGGSVPTTDESTEVVWRVSSANLAGGAKTPKRLETTVQTWQEETASLILGMIGAPGNIPLALPRLEDILDLMVNDTGWVNLAMSNGWSYSPESRPQIRVRAGVLYMRGFVTRDGSTTGNIGLIPFNTRPSRQLAFHDGGISISTEGIITETEALVNNVSLDDISYVVG